MEKAVITGVVFYGSGKFNVCVLVPARSGIGKSGEYEGFGSMPISRGAWGMTTPELKTKIVNAFEKKIPVSLLYDSYGNIFDIA